MDYLRFLEGTEKEDKGRYVTDILKYGSIRLELVHNYVQRMFPTNEQSKFSNIKPITDEDIALLRASDTAKENISKMYQKMLVFWKIDGDRYKKWGSGAPFRLWNNWNNHNHWRMTRVIKCFMLLGMEGEHKDFSMRLSTILEIKKSNPLSVRITKKTEEIWRRKFWETLNN